MARGTWQGGGTWQTSGGGGGLVLIVVIVIAAAALGSGAASAAVSALEVIAVMIACLAAAAVAGGIALLVYRTRSGPRRSDRPGPPIEARPVYQLPPESRPELSSEHKPAIEPGREIHLHFHIADPAEAAEIIRTAIPGQAGDAITERK